MSNENGKEIGSNVAAMSAADRERSAVALKGLRDEAGKQKRAYEDHCRICAACGKESDWSPYEGAPADQRLRVLLHCHQGWTLATRWAGSAAVFLNSEASLKNFGVTI